MSFVGEQPGILRALQIIIVMELMHVCFGNIHGPWHDLGWCLSERLLKRLSIEILTTHSYSDSGNDSAGGENTFPSSHPRLVLIFRTLIRSKVSSHLSTLLNAQKPLRRILTPIQQAFHQAIGAIFRLLFKRKLCLASPEMCICDIICARELRC